MNNKILTEQQIKDTLTEYRISATLRPRDYQIIAACLNKQVELTTKKMANELTDKLQDIIHTFEDDYLLKVGKSVYNKKGGQ